METMTINCDKCEITPSYTLIILCEKHSHELGIRFLEICQEVA